MEKNSHILVKGTDISKLYSTRHKGIIFRRTQNKHILISYSVSIKILLSHITQFYINTYINIQFVSNTYIGIELVLRVFNHNIYYSPQKHKQTVVSGTNKQTTIRQTDKHSTFVYCRIVPRVI